MVVQCGVLRGSHVLGDEELLQLHRERERAEQTRRQVRQLQEAQRESDSKRGITQHHYYWSLESGERSTAEKLKEELIELDEDMHALREKFEIVSKKEK